MMMYVNVALDFVVGLIPLAGDFADMLFKANSRNYKLLEMHLAEKGARSPAPPEPPQQSGGLRRFFGGGGTSRDIAPAMMGPVGGVGTSANIPAEIPMAHLRGPGMDGGTGYWQSQDQRGDVEA
jgi:Domain of unknown function (DUF4112)